MKRFKVTESGYIFDNLLFYACFFLVLGGFFLILYLNDFNIHPNFYAVCEAESCINPYYSHGGIDCKNEVKVLWFITLYKDSDCLANCDWCKQPYLGKGVYGTPTPFYVRFFWAFGVGLLVLTFVFNHYIHNRGKKFDIEICFTKNKKVSVMKTIKEWGRNFDKD